ncbi:delta-aminolevulinate dehydratase [Pelomyxa schiedti]|nr:delta-aminolevulinate dehydratase [Pelomyxa schiedti]
MEKKALKLKSKTDAVKTLFNLPSTESVIQDYRCYLKGFMTVGRMSITQNYILWKSKLSAAQESIHFTKVKQIVQETAFFKTIVIQTDSSAYTFNGFMHYQETLYLLLYLWKHPVSYVTMDNIPDPTVTAKPAKPKRDADDLLSGGGYSGTGRTSTTTSVSAGYDGEEDQLLDVEVDVGASKEALRRALECRDISEATMAELALQGEVLDVMEHDVEKIHHDLDKGERHIRGCESIGGTIKNKVTHVSRGAHKDMHYIDRTIQVAEKVVIEEIDILQKLTNDDFIPAVLHLEPEGFSLLPAQHSLPATATPTPATTTSTASSPPPDKSKPADKSKSTAASTTPAKPKLTPYDTIHQIVVRARPQHVDIRFPANKGERMRMMTSYMQWVLCEFHKRAPTALIVFEPNAPRFEYEDPHLLERCATNRKTKSGAAGAVTAKGVDPLIKSAPSHLQAALLEQDRDLDEITDVIGDLHGMASAMTGTIDDQITQIERVTKRAEQANERMNVQGQRIDGML